MATSTVGDAVSASLLPSYFYLLLMPQGRTACEPPRKLCYNPKSSLYRFVPALTWFFRALLKCHLLRFAQMSPSPCSFLGPKSINFLPLRFPPSIVFSSLAFTILLVLNFLVPFPPTEKISFGVLFVHYHISEPITVTIFFRMKEFTCVSFLGQAGHELSPAKIFSWGHHMPHFQAFLGDLGNRGPNRYLNTQVSKIKKSSQLKCKEQ